MSTTHRAIKPDNNFGSRRIYYNNFAEHLLNAYNPNMTYLGLPYRWSDDDWRACIDMVAAFGFTVFEFWLVPRLLCREGLGSAFGREFARQMNVVGKHAHRRGMKIEFICGLATVGSDWHTLCPNVPDEWREVRFLWDAWLRRLPETDIVGLFPGDPGACSRTGCTALTYIDKCCEIAALARQVLPQVEIELHTWGPPFFGWGNIRGPKGWKGEFVQSYQHTAWDFDKRRADVSMRHLVKRLTDFPDGTSVALNMGFNSDGNPAGEQDARPWVHEIARTNPVHTWDFSLTEGENAVIPHWRFERLFQRRREERSAGPYQGGICFTMTPRLNQLTLFMAAQSFLRPDADPDALAGEFLSAMLGPAGRDLVPLLPLFEVIRDWGNYRDIRMPRAEYHAKLCVMRDILEGAGGQETDVYPVIPSPRAWREELLFWARLFADLSAPAPDYDALHDRYWHRVYAVYDCLPEHVDPRPRQATRALIRHFVNWDRPADAGPIPGKWQ
jgi:hypothetical protein